MYSNVDDDRRLLRETVRALLVEQSSHEDDPVVALLNDLRRAFKDVGLHQAGSKRADESDVGGARTTRYIKLRDSVDSPANVEAFFTAVGSVLKERLPGRRLFKVFEGPGVWAQCDAYDRFEIVLEFDTQLRAKRCVLNTVVRLGSVSIDPDEVRAALAALGVPEKDAIDRLLDSGALVRADDGTIGLARAEQVDWRPGEGIPEDYYAL